VAQGEGPEFKPQYCKKKKKKKWYKKKKQKPTRPKQENTEFEDTLGYTARLYLKNKQQQKAVKPLI
jgi:hypothetical protein